MQSRVNEKKEDNGMASGTPRMVRLGGRSTPHPTTTRGGPASLQVPFLRLYQRFRTHSRNYLQTRPRTEPLHRFFGNALFLFPFYCLRVWGAPRDKRGPPAAAAPLIRLLYNQYPGGGRLQTPHPLCGAGLVLGDEHLANKTVFAVWRTPGF